MQTSITDELSGNGDLPSDVMGIILAGGQSTRLGQNKAFIEIDGQTLVERVARRLYRVVAQIVLVTNSPDEFAFVGLPMTADLIPGVGAAGGLHAGLSAIGTEYGFVVGCDMPFLNVSLMRYLISLREGYDVVIPRLGQYHEPLHAVYSRRCLATIEERVRSGRRRILDVCRDLRVRYVDEIEIDLHDPHHLSFFNINDPQDLEEMRALWTSGRVS